MDTLKAAKALAWRLTPWRKKALISIQREAHPGVKGGFIVWRSKTSPYEAVWGAGSGFYRATYREWETPVAFDSNVNLISLAKDTPQGWVDIRRAIPGKALVLPLAKGY